MKTYIVLMIMTICQFANAGESSINSLLNGAELGASTSLESSKVSDDFTAITSEIELLGWPLSKCILDTPKR